MTRGVLSADAFANPPRLPYKIGKEGANGSEGYIATYSEDDSQKYYPLPVNPLPVSPHPEVSSCSSPLPCTEPVSSRDGHTKSDYLEAPADGQEEGRLEIPLVVRHDMAKEIQLERAPGLGGKGKMMPKRKCPVLKPPPTGTRLGIPGESHPEMQQLRIRGKFTFSSRRWVNPETTSQVTARQLAKLPMIRQQGGVTAWSTE